MGTEAEAELRRRAEGLEDQKSRAAVQKADGNRMFALSDYQGAAGAYSRAIGFNPSDHTLYSNRSACYVHLKLYEQAVTDAKTITKLNPTFVKGWGRLGTALKAQGLYEEAWPAFMQGFKLDSTMVDYRRQAEECKEKCQKGLGIAGEETKKAFYREKHKQQGLEEFKKGNFVSAIRYFTQAIDLDITNHVLISNRSAAYCKLAASPATSLAKAPAVYKEALEDAERCINLAPTYGKGFARKGAALHGLCEYKKSKAAYEAGLKVEPSSTHCKDGLAAVERVLVDITEETEEWLDKKEENKKQDKLAEENPDMCAIPDKKIPSVFCYKCGKEGHFPSNCKERIIQGVKGGGYAHTYTTCHYCGEMGHSKNDCPELARKRGATKGRFETAEDTAPSAPSSALYCFKCGSNTHNSSGCHLAGAKTEAKEARRWQDSYQYNANKRQRR